jgi:hypothetical protein
MSVSQMIFGQMFATQNVCRPSGFRPKDLEPKTLLFQSEFPQPNVALTWSIFQNLFFLRQINKCVWAAVQPSLIFVGKHSKSAALC